MNVDLNVCCPCTSPLKMKHYCAKPSAQLPKHMYNIILHCCYKLADNHLTLFQLHNIIRAVKAMGIIHGVLLLKRAVNKKNVHCTILRNQPATCASIVPSQQIQAKKLSRIVATLD